MKRGGLASLAVAACLVLWKLGAGSAQASFGLLAGSGGFSLVARNQDGSPDNQAGSHPYTFTTNFAFNSHPNGRGEAVPDDNAKDIQVALPPGFAGNPGAATKCLPQQLALEALEEVGLPGQTCPTSSQIGMMALHFGGGGQIGGGLPLYFPVYNMATAADQPAVFGFQVNKVGVYIDTGVRTGGDYGLTSSVRSISSVFQLVGSSLTLWGVPADSSHDSQRCIHPTYETGICEGGPGNEAESPHSAGAST